MFPYFQNGKIKYDNVMAFLHYVYIIISFEIKNMPLFYIGMFIVETFIVSKLYITDKKISLIYFEIVRMIEV